MSISIGPVSLRDPVLLAPMSGVSDRPFRRMVRRFGAGLVISEMVASDAMLRAVREEVRKAEIDADDAPAVVQLAGWEPAVMAEAARIAVDGGAAIVDINMGRSEEHTSELQSLMRISYAVFCVKKKTKKLHTTTVRKNN